jgi:glycosyltransferase involved in cell wall biosynthesis
MKTGKSMRILSLTNCPLDPVLGSGKTVLTYTSGLRSLGHEVVVAAPADYEWMPSFVRARKFRQAIGAWRYVRAAVARKSYDLIEFYGDEFWLAARWLSRRQRRPFLVAHSNGFEPLYHERARAMSPRPVTLGQKGRSLLTEHTHERFSQVAFQSADAFVGLCDIDRRSAVERGFFSTGRAATVPPGLDEEFLNRPQMPPEAPRVAFTGSWIPRKGTDKLARVMYSIMSRNESVKLDVFGAGGAVEEVRTSFPESLRGRIHVHPRLTNSDMAARLSRASVFFFPTQYEGFGMALAEAMACGCVPVTTPTGYGAEIAHGSEGHLCDFTDENGMEKAVEELLRNEARRRSMAASAHRKVQALQWERCTGALEELYLRWLEESGSSRLSPALLS